MFMVSSIDESRQRLKRARGKFLKTSYERQPFDRGKRLMAAPGAGLLD
jgi:hypothetical protein